jgi:hypothetical protein
MMMMLKLANGYSRVAGHSCYAPEKVGSINDMCVDGNGFYCAQEVDLHS